MSFQVKKYKNEKRDLFIENNDLFCENIDNRLKQRRTDAFKHGVKSKSLDIFDRPSSDNCVTNSKRQITRVRSLASIPEHSVQVSKLFKRKTFIQVEYFKSEISENVTEDDLVIQHRSPVTFANGYRRVIKQDLKGKRGLSRI